MAEGLRNVFSRMETRRYTFGDPIACHETDPGAHGSALIFQVRCNAVQRDLACMRDEAEEGPTDILVTGTAKPCEPQQLATTDLETDRADGTGRQA